MTRPPPYINRDSQDREVRTGLIEARRSSARASVTHPTFRAGRPAEARPLWEKVLRMAEGYQDAATADTARSRVGRWS
jgi:hypothetical protein